MADGPCPHCHIPIQVELKAGIREPDLATQEEQSVKNTFERRRFRPATHATKTGTPAHRRLSDC
ncbi:hypothetical protein [Roseibacillus persicicus]|nr:hypothetical protein [Roseibacillus persicicus]MDQ8189171.1 hypothetical protein [Roseibacillus persicicus]